jgi:hypothetical protein
MTEHRINDTGWTDQGHLCVYARGVGPVMVHTSEAVHS